MNLVSVDPEKLIEVNLRWIYRVNQKLDSIKTDPISFDADVILLEIVTELLKESFGLTFSYMTRVKAVYFFQRQHAERLRFLKLLVVEDSQVMLSHDLFRVMATIKLNKKGETSWGAFHKAYKAMTT